VLKLQRTEFAGIKLGTLKPGDFRMLTRSEVARLKRQTEVNRRSGETGNG